MTTLERSVFISATPAAVAAVVEDVARITDWFTGAQSATAEDNWPAVGSTAQVNMSAAGLAYVQTTTVAERVAGERLLLDMGGLTTGTTLWRFSAENGGTNVTCTLTYTLSDDETGQAVGELIAERAHKISIEQSLTNLNALIENRLTRRQSA
jgi:carbon monoxide dehydrogenase subunit G